MRRVRFPWDKPTVEKQDYPRLSPIFKLNKDGLPYIERYEDTQEIINSVGRGFTIYDILARCSRGELSLIDKYHLENVGGTQRTEPFKGLDFTKLPDNILDGIDLQRSAQQKLYDVQAENQKALAENKVVSGESVSSKKLSADNPERVAGSGNFPVADSDQGRDR